MTDHDQPTDRSEDDPEREPRREPPVAPDDGVDPDAPGRAALHPLDEAPDVEPNEPA